MSYQVKLLGAFILYGLLLVVLALFSFTKLYELNIQAISVEKAEEVYSGKAELFDLMIADVRKKLTTLEQSEAFRHYLEAPKAIAPVETLMFNLTQANSNIMRLCFIDETGRERVRIDRKRFGGPVWTQEVRKLQSHEGMADYEEVMALPDGQIWFSNLELNTEYGRIEEPFKPVLRAALPVSIDGSRRGYLMIKLFMGSFFDRLGESPMHYLYLVDKNGQFLYHPDPHHRWSHTRNHPRSLAEEFGEEDTYCMLNNTECYGEQVYSNMLGLNNDEGLRIVVEPKFIMMQEELRKQFIGMVYILGGLLLLAFPLAFFFARVPAKLKKDVDRLNQRLRAKVDQKVAELKELNIALEEQVTERTKALEHANAELFKSATTDYLTGIPNRRYFFEVGERYLELAHRKQQPLTLLIIDIDHFKQVNDSYGHETGDGLLVCFTETVGARLRKSDVFGRIGGEEFAVLLSDTALEEAKTIAVELQEAVKVKACRCYSHELSMTVSIGVSDVRLDETDLTPLFRRADEALYRAKEGGRDRVETVSAG